MRKTVEIIVSSLVCVAGFSVSQAADASSIEGIKIGESFRFGVHELRWDEDTNGDKYHFAPQLNSMPRASMCGFSSRMEPTIRLAATRWLSWWK